MGYIHNMLIICQSYTEAGRQTKNFEGKEEAEGQTKNLEGTEEAEGQTKNLQKWFLELPRTPSGS